MVFHADKVREMYWDYGTEQQRLATPEETQMFVTSLKAELNKDSGKWHYLHKVGVFFYKSSRVSDRFAFVHLTSNTTKVDN